MSTLLLDYDNVQLVWTASGVNHNEGALIPHVYVTASDRAEEAYQLYKNYNQSNILQVGTWANDGGAGTTTATLNATWDTVCAAFGVNQKKASLIATSTYSSAPSSAMKDDFIINLMKYFPRTINRLSNTMTSSQSYYQRRSNTNYALYASGYASVSNFRREVHFMVFDLNTRKWYMVGWEYRTDNFNPGKVWLVTSKIEPSALTFPTSGIPLINPSNPYPGIDDSEAEGGETNPDGFTGDTIPEPSLPTISALGTGLVKLYNPTASQLSSFGQWLWGSGFSLDSLKRIFSDPMDMIIGLNIFPVSPPTATTPDSIKLGNLDSEVNSKVVSAQYTTFDMGSVGVPYAYGSYLDFAPYTKVQIFLPFIGMKTLNTDEVMSKPGSPKYIHVSYSIDLLSGACVAHISVGPDTSHLSLMYEFGGSCSAQVPLTARDMTSLVSSIAGLVGVGAGAVLGTVMMPGAAMTGFAGGAVSASMIASVGAGGAKQVIGSKPTVEHSGGIGSSSGFLSSQQAYLIVERPRICHPANQEHFTGYPGFLYGVVSQLEGFTKFVNIELNNVLAEEEELEELEDWLVNRGVRL